jgi:hypothetical protein
MRINSSVSEAEENIPCCPLKHGEPATETQQQHRGTEQRKKGKARGGRTRRRRQNKKYKANVNERAKQHNNKQEKKGRK